jgi:hypothetical protein
MSNKVSNQEYKSFLEYKIQNRKNKIFDSLQKEFLNYLRTGKIISEELPEDDGKNFKDFFTRILKNVFFSSLYKKLTSSFLTKLNSFQKKSFQSFKNKSFKRVVVLSDKKVTKEDSDFRIFADKVNSEWGKPISFRTIPQHDKTWLINNIVSEINSDLFTKSIANVIKKFPKLELKEKFYELKKLSDGQLTRLWTTFVETKVWYSHGRFIKANEFLADNEIASKLNEIYSLIDDETLLIINNNNENENTFFEYLFNFENELFNRINDKKNISLLVLSKQNTYKNTFLGLLSIGNLESINDIDNLDYENENFEDTIDFSEYNLNDSENYSNTIEMFSDKKNIVKKKTTTTKKTSKRSKKNITDPTKTIALDSINNSETLDSFLSNNTKSISNKNSFEEDEKTLREYENDNDLMKPFEIENDFINREIEKYADELESKKIVHENKISKNDSTKKVSTIDFEILDDENEKNVSESILYKENETEFSDDDDFLNNVVVNSFNDLENKTNENGLDKIVLNTHIQNLFEYIKYKSTFESFISIFNYAVKQHDINIFENVTPSKSFEDTIKNFDLAATYNFLKNRAANIIDILYSDNINKTEINNCFVIYNKVFAKLTEVDDLITLLSN